METGSPSNRDRAALDTLRRRHEHLLERSLEFPDSDNHDAREANAIEWALELADEVKRRGGLLEAADAFLEREE